MTILKTLIEQEFNEKYNDDKKTLTKSVASIDETWKRGSKNSPLGTIFLTTYFFIL